ncbi:exocyst complex component EXO70E2-like [Fagus crenata]
MGDFSPVLSPCEGETHVIAAAQHLVKALGASKNLDDDLRKILSQLDSHLSAMTILTTESKGAGFREIEERLRYAEEKIRSWESNQSLIRDSDESDPLDFSELLKAIDEIQALTEGVRSLSVNENGKQKELLNRADSILQMAMSRLEDELIHILVKHKQYFEPGYVSFRSCGKDVLYDESFVSVEDIEEELQKNSSGNESDEYIQDLVHPHVIPHLKSIANAMFGLNYDQEFCQAFISVRRDALEEYLVILKVEKFSIDDVLKMEWSSLNFEIKKWVRAMNIIIRYLASEKRLCGQVLGDYGFVNPLCFVEISKVSLVHLLDFGEAIAMGTHQPEKLFRLLDMYEVVADNLLDLDALFSEEAGASVRIEFHELLRSLGGSARAIFVKFGSAIAANASTRPYPGGGIHPLTKYVMNYIKTLTTYCNTLNVLLKDQNAADPNPLVEPENGQGVSSFTYCQMACHFRSITATLESNLDRKSKLYKDDALQHFFLMNNFHYMVQKVKSCELSLFFGDDWIREHIVKFQQHARDYERATWNSVLSLLKDDNSSKAILKEKCRGFTIAFEEVYKNQTGWSITDPHLREDLQISTSQNVIHAYRSFMGRKSSSISDKYIKYTPDDLENYILDLFTGSPRILQSSRRK